MPRVKVDINKGALTRDIRRQLHKNSRLNKEVEKRANIRFEKIKKDFIREFMSHRVTAELNSGAGELFYFIGFPSGSDPVSPLLNLLEDRIFIRYRKFNRRGRAQFTINLPTPMEINRLSPMPWATGLSWTKGIETGIPDFGKFLEVDGRPSSRSGGGIQTKNEIHSYQFKKQPYLFQMLSKYTQIFSKFGFLLK